MKIPIFDTAGKIVNSITLPEPVQYVGDRVCKGQKYYYKGVGIPYKYHHIHPQDMTEQYTYIDTCPVFYIGNIVSKKCYKHKFGIFQEKYQTHFTDWIGSCGVKELNIFENLYDEGGFEMTAVEVFGYEIIDEEHQQYYLKVDYPHGRKNYLSQPNSIEMRKLLDYMIVNDWNFPWDKNSISDISVGSRVTDVADIFKSNKLGHKIGTIYSVLYSLYNTNQKEYFNFCEKNLLRHENQMSFVFNSLSILSSNGVDISKVFQNDIVDTYKNVVLNYLIIGKNCGFCGVGSCKGRKDINQSYGEEILDEYIKRTKMQLNL